MGSNPTRGTHSEEYCQYFIRNVKLKSLISIYALVAEQEDALDLGSSTFGCVGSTPTERTKKITGLSSSGDFLHYQYYGIISRCEEKKKKSIKSKRSFMTAKQTDRKE